MFHLLAHARRLLSRALRQRTGATPEDMIGPAYVPGAPPRMRLCPEDEPGERLVVRGSVRAADDGAPIAGARLEVWQTDDRGYYANVLGLPWPRGKRRMNLRGTLRSDVEGGVHIETIVPGLYPPPFKRPRHIHFLVAAEGFEPLVCQLYFEGDARLGAREREAHAAMIVTTEEQPHDGWATRRAPLELRLERARR
jgi:protocatechuate 3,4-dioxygenase beta subunit